MTAKDTFALISNSLAQGDLKEACDRFYANRDALYQENPLLTLKTNFELRFIAEEFEQAYADNEYFQALPYISQEVEEYLRELPRLIRANELSSFQRKPKSEEAILKLLTPKTKNEELLFTVSSLQSQDIAPYLNALIALLTSPVHDDVKSFILMLLVAKNVDCEITMIKRGKTYHLNPQKVGVPFGNSYYERLKDEVKKDHDVAVGEIAVKLLDQLSLYCYPERPLLNGDFAFTVAALLQLARSYLDPKAELGEEGKALSELLSSVEPLGI